tara:strand:- start:264 stop:1241 length:978 start_codon:yes stop_codon:yes gene_type:complete
MEISFKLIKQILFENKIKFTSNLNDDDNFKSIESIQSSNKSSIIFLFDNKYLNNLQNVNAKCCVLKPENIKFLSDKIKYISVQNPYLAFACLSNLFSPINKSNNTISNNANITDNQIFPSNVQIDSYTSIGKNTFIDEFTIIHSNCSIGPNVKIGKNVTIFPNCYISNCEIGDNTIIQPGVVIGGDGFGFEINTKSKIQHMGTVLIGKNCSIGSNTTIDRAVLDKTIISDESNLDNLIQIAHNVIIGKGAVIAAQVGIAGSTSIGDNVKIGGQAGIAGHLNIGNNVTIAAKSGVTKNLNNNSIVAGFPATDIKIWKRNLIKLNKM